MDVNEMRKSLRGYCRSKEMNDDGNCIGCVFEDCRFCDTTNFDIAPDEMIHKWYAMAFPEPIIKDSGERREFATGAVRDMANGKGRMDLMPWSAILEVSKHCENGAIKYGEHNVDKGLPTSSFCDSGARHLAKHLAGWEDEPHLVAAVWNLLWAVEMTIKHPELVDTPWRADNA